MTPRPYELCNAPGLHYRIHVTTGVSLRRVLGARKYFEIDRARKPPAGERMRVAS